MSQPSSERSKTMAKKDKRRAHEVRGHMRGLEDAIQEQGPLPATQEPYDHGPPPANPTPYQRDRQPLPLSLADIRSEALRQHANVAHTIADLEAWAAEIASTIAFLKARGQ